MKNVLAVVCLLGCLPACSRGVPKELTRDLAAELISERMKQGVAKVTVNSGDLCELNLERNQEFESFINASQPGLALLIKKRYVQVSDEREVSTFLLDVYPVCKETAGRYATSRGGGLANAVVARNTRYWYWKQLVTDEGRKAGVQIGGQYAVFMPELVEVTGITHPQANMARAEFDYENGLAEDAKKLKLEMGVTPELLRNAADFTRYDDGWRLTRFAVPLAGQ
jgi:hypothetical protein